MLKTFRRFTRIDAPAQVVFDWFKQPGALERLTPPWLKLHVVERTGSIRDGDRLTFKIKIAGIRQTWLIEHRDYVEGEQFRDLQLKGPFTRWEHTHRFGPAAGNACEVADEIKYELPLGGFGQALGESFVEDQLRRAFDYRDRILAAEIAVNRRDTSLNETEPMRVAISGSHGLVGGALVPLLTTRGHEVKRIVRGPVEGRDEIAWFPSTGKVESRDLAGLDAVVHLAGEPIFGQWNDVKKRKIRDSRVIGTRGLCEALARLERKPRVLVCASAVGYYGDRGDELLTEESEPGENFIAQATREWEQATQAADNAGIRVVNLRLGAVLTPHGGALGAMLPFFQCGLGGPMGGGQQWMSWISIEDVIGIIHEAMFNDAVRGPINVVAPEAVTNRQFAQTLGKVLHRPALIPTPAFILRNVLGEPADQVILASQRVAPMRLAKAGYLFRHPDLEQALRALLGK